MKDAAGELSMVDSTALDGAKTIFAELQKKGSALSPDTKSLEAYRYAMQVEEDSATLYQEAAEKETNPQIRELLLRIATEERKHLNILENVFEFVNAPNQSLVWGEFSNLKEF
jgi:rubrerythrin